MDGPVQVSYRGVTIETGFGHVDVVVNNAVGNLPNDNA
jgi:hypothetical protein